MAKNKKIGFKNNYKFIDSLIANDETFFDYLDRFKKIALSVFEWVNLPKTMDARWLEKCLYFDGQATLLKSKKYGYINTRCSTDGDINIYGLPTKMNCYSFSFQESRKLYNGLINNEGDDKECILVQNNWDRIPTCATLELFAYRLYEAEAAAFTNIKAQKTPVLLIADETQRLLIENLYSQYDGNRPFIIGDKKQLNADTLKCLKTDAPFVADKIMEYKKEIWNEALTFLRY